jgi:tetratricopeptide (TPR) repeat protein/serine/threonine protein kinase
MAVWNPRANDLFLQALEVRDAAQRQEFVLRASGGDAELCSQVQALLRASDRAGSFLQGPALAAAGAETGEEGWPSTGEGRNGPTGSPEPAEGPGVVIGPYKLLQPVGEGGMGAVFMAEQGHPVQRKVAVKLIKAGMDSAQVIARFEAERQALALMDHPNIARVLDAGTTESGRPYFVMELVKGAPITRYCDEHQLTLRERLELFVPVSQAVQHAHQKGIIHRDVKPSNVLVAEYDDRPVAKVIDFGIAKATGPRLTERTLFTEFGQVVGTLEYMSPEQAELNALDIDTRSDIYSLGVLLYELLTGTTPFERKRLGRVAFDEVLRIIREEEPPRPSTRISATAELPSIAANRGLEPKRLSGLVRGELDWIVMKCLEKDRNRRYESANGLARDIERYLRDEPVRACPPSVRYRLGKFVRRNKTGLGIAGVVLFFLVLLGALVGWMVGDRAVRRDKLAGDLTEALDRVVFFLDEGKRAEGREALDHARSLAQAGSPSPALSRRLEELKEGLDAADTDHDFIRRFETIRLEVQTRVNVEENYYPQQDSFPEIKKILGDYGIEVGTTAPAQAAARIQGRPQAVQTQLLAALGECRRCAPEGDARTLRWLNEVLTTAESDPWRREVWQAIAARDWTALRRLVRRVDVRKQPPSLLSEVARLLDRPTALAVLRSIQRAYPRDFWANHDLAGQLLEMGKPSEAVRYYTAALARRHDSPGVYNNRALALKAAGEWDAAIADLRHALVLAPRYRGAHRNLFIALKGKGQVDGALAACRQAVARIPHDATLYYNLGNALQDKGDPEAAVTAYRRAIALDPRLAVAHSNLGSQLLARGDKEGALAAQHRAVAAGPNNSEVQGNLAATLLATGDVEGALAAFCRAIVLAPNYPGPRFGLSHVLRARNDAEGEIAALRRVLDLDPGFFKAHFNLGLALRAKGDIEGAITSFRRAADLEAKSARAHHFLGNALRGKGDVDEAIASFRLAVAADPGYPEAFWNLGHALFLKGEYGEALVAQRKGYQLGSGKPGWSSPSMKWVAECERWAGLEKRLPALLRGEEKPKNRQEKIDFARLCARKGYSAAAARLNQEAISANPARPGLRYQAACSAALVGCGRGKDAGPLDDRERARWRNQALTWLRAELEQQSIQLDTNTPAARRAVRRLLGGWKQDLDLAGVRDPAALAWLPEGERQAWLRLWLEVDALFERVPGADGHASQGGALLAQGKLAEAEASFRKAVLLRPKEPRLHRQLGEILFRLDKREEAVAYFTRARELLPDQPWMWYFDAVAHLGAGNVDGCKTVCRAMLARFGDTRDRGTAMRLIHTCVTIPDAVVDSSRLPPLAEFGAPFWPGGVRTVGAALYRAGRHKEAIRRFAEAAQEGARDAWDWFFLAMAHHRLGRADKAAEALRKGREAAARNRQDPAVPWYRRVEEESLIREAAALLGRARDGSNIPDAAPFRPKDGAAHAAALGDILRRHGQPDAAAAEYREALRLEPDFTDARSRLRAVLAETGRWPEAIAERRQNLLRHPHDASAHNDLAWLLATCVGRKYRNAGRAVEVADKAVQLAPREGTYWNTLGVARYRAGDSKAAITALEKSMALREGGDSWDWFFLAMAHQQLGRKQEARKWYDRASAWLDRRQPGNEELLRFQGEAAALLGIPGLARGNFYAELGDCERAAADYTRAFEKAPPTNAMIWMWHAHLRLRVGDRAGYRKLCVQMRERFGASKNIDLFALLAHTCVLAPDGLEDAKAALLLAERRFALTPSPSVHHAWSFHVLGLACYRAREHRKAVEWLARGLKKHWQGEREVFNWAVLAMAHQRLGYTAEARKWFARTEQWIRSRSRLAEESGCFAPPGWDWAGWLGIGQLHREAGEVLKKPLANGKHRPDAGPK